MSSKRTFSAFAVVLAFAGALALSGCKSKTGGAALLATVDVEDPLSPTCVVFEVSANGTTRFTQTLADDGSKKQFKIGIEQGDLPGTVQLRAFASKSANGCDLPRLVLSASKSVDGKFPSGGVGQVSLTITSAPPSDLDADGDTHVAASAGGDDCNDNDAMTHPGAAQNCSSSADTDCNGQAGCLDAACMSQGICASGATSLAFNTNPVTAAPGSCAGPVTVGLRNAASMPVAATAPVTVTFTTQPTGISFWSDSNCTMPVLSQTIATNQSAATVYFSGPAAGSYVLTAAAPALTSAQQTEVLSSTTASQLVFSSQPRTVTAGKCSQEIDLETHDANGAKVPVANAMQVALTASQSGVTFYSDSTCATALPGAVLPFPAGTSSAKFYVEATQALATMLTASFTGLTPATQALTVNPEVADHLVFVTGQMGVMSSQCSGAVLLEARDVFENPSLPPNGQTIALSETGVGGFSFFTDSNCTMALTGGLPFTAGTPQAHYYFMGTTAGTATMTADASPAFAAINQDAVVGVGPPAALRFTSGPQSAPSVTCSSSPVVVQVFDATNNPVTVTAGNGPIAVTLSAAPSAGFTLYADAGCQTPLTANMLSIPIGSSSASFWFKGTTVGPVVVTAASSPLMQDMQTESIIAGPPTQLVFSSPARTSPAGQCTQFDLAALDSQGNAATVGADTTLALTANPATVNFFSAPGCAAASSTTSVTMTMGSGTVSFYASGTTAGVPQLTATAPFGQADQTFTVQGGAPTALAVTTPAPLGIASDACSGPITIELRDAFGNVTQAPVQTDVTSSSTATGPFNFYLGGNCGGSPMTVSPIAAGNTNTTVSFKGRKAESFNLSFTHPALSMATQGGSIVAGAATQIAFSTPSRFGVSAGACSPVVTLQRLDTYGNLAVGPALSLTVSATGSAQLFTDACVTSAGGVASFGAGADHTDLYFSDNVAEGFQINATGTGVGSANQQEGTTGGGPSQLVYLTAPQSLDAGSCSGVVTLQRRDMNGNPSSPDAGTTVTLTWGGTGTMGYFTDPACGTALSGGTFDILPNQSNGQFYFSSTVAETNNLTASANLVSPAVQQEIINAGPPSKLAFITAPLTVDALVCSATKVGVQSQDAFGNPSNVTAATNVNLTSSGNAAPGTFSVTASTCNPAVLTVPIVGNLASFNFYAATSGTLTIGAQATGLGPMVTQDETVRSAPAKQLTLETSVVSPAEAGACVPVTVTRRDQAGNPTAPNNSTTVTLSVLPASGLLFFSDAACTASASQVTIASATSATTYYFKGITGGTGSTAATYSLGATAPGLTAGSLSYDILQMVRRGTCTLANNSNSVTCAVAPAIPQNDISRTFLVYQGSDIYSQEDRDDVECHLVSASTAVNVVCTRQNNPGGGAPPAVTITWQTVSNAHDSTVSGGWSVQHVTGTFSNNSTGNPLTANLGTAVTPGQTFTLSATSESGTANRAVGFMTAELTANNVVLTQGGGANKFTNNGTYSFEVVSMNGAVVNRGTATPATTGGSFTASATTPDTARTALLFSARTDDSGTSLDAMCKRRFRGAVTNATTLTFTRGAGAGGACTSNNVEAISWEEIIFPTNTSVQQLSITVNAAGTSGSGALASTVDTTRTLLFMPGHGPGGASAGETTYATSDALGTAVGTPTFVNSGTVQVTRPNLVANSTVYSVFAVQFSP